MFFFSLVPSLAGNFILIAAAVIPAAFLMIKVYKADRLEKESGYMLRRLVSAGILSTILAVAEERMGIAILSSCMYTWKPMYNVILYFGIVGVAEETSKYIFLKARTWKNPEFNCQFDGIVYSVFVSLGFALWENIGYVFKFGFDAALIRAVTAIPGHACFGVFMGVFYGMAKRFENEGNHSASLFARILAVSSAIMLHGAYDYIASTRSMGKMPFIIFVAAMFIIAFVLVGRTSKKDRYI